MGAIGRFGTARSRDSTAGLRRKSAGRTAVRGRRTSPRTMAAVVVSVLVGSRDRVYPPSRPLRLIASSLDCFRLLRVVTALPVSAFALYRPLYDASRSRHDAPNSAASRNYVLSLSARCRCTYALRVTSRTISLAKAVWTRLGSPRCVHSHTRRSLSRDRLST